MRRSQLSIPGFTALLVAGSLFVGAPAPAGADEYGPFPLDDISEMASWSGALQTGPPFPSPFPPEACVPDVCDIVRLNVQLPEGVWAQPGGMLVATQTPGNYPARADDVDLFSLYVYYGDGPDRRLVAKSTSWWTTGDHAAWVENPVNGLYTVVIAPNFLDSDDQTAYYDGLVSFDRGLTVKREELREGLPYTQTFVAFGLASAPKPPVELKPDLIPTAPGNFHIETGTCLNPSFCDPSPAQQPSCYPEETSGETSHTVPPTPGPTRCLRFDQGEYNFGDGPLELHIYPRQVNPAGEIEVYQRVYRSDGSVSEDLVGGAVFHPSHHHFHYTGQGGWWEIKLHERLPNGEPGDVVEKATFPLKGICPLDVASGRFGQRGNGPQVYGNEDPQTCFTPRHQDPNDDARFQYEPYIQAGISVGWADFYVWYGRDQYIDITDVPDGKYIIVTKQDPGQHLIEKTRANNTAMACVEISGMGTTARPCPMEADLSITKTGPPGRVPTGRNMTYTLAVTNNGPDEASEVVVTDQLPPSVTFVSAVIDLPVGYCDPPSGGILTCHLGPIGSGVERRVYITVKPTQAGTITNSASVTSPTPDNNQGNNADSEDTSICRQTTRRTTIPCG